MARPTKPVHEGPMPSLAQMYEEVKGKPSGATRPHTLNPHQFSTDDTWGDENLTPEDKERYKAIGEGRIKNEDPMAKKPKYGDQQNPLPPGGRKAMKPPVPPTPHQRTRQMLRTAKTLGRLAKTAKGRRR